MRGGSIKEKKEGSYSNHLEQSVLGEIEKGILIPQLEGRDWARSDLIVRLLAAVLMQLHALFLSAEVDAAAASALAPEQQATGGLPLPLDK